MSIKSSEEQSIRRILSLNWWVITFTVTHSPLQPANYRRELALTDWRPHCQDLMTQKLMICLLYNLITLIFLHYALQELCMTQPNRLYLYTRYYHIFVIFLFWGFVMFLSFIPCQPILLVWPANQSQNSKVLSRPEHHLLSVMKTLKILMKI